MVPATPTGASSLTEGSCPAGPVGAPRGPSCGALGRAPGPPAGSEVTVTFSREDQGQGWQLTGSKRKSVGTWCWCPRPVFPRVCSQKPPLLSRVEPLCRHTPRPAPLARAPSLKFGVRPLLVLQRGLVTRPLLALAVAWGAHLPQGWVNLTHQPSSPLCQGVAEVPRSPPGPVRNHLLSRFALVSPLTRLINSLVPQAWSPASTRLRGQPRCHGCLALLGVSVGRVGGEPGCKHQVKHLVVGVSAQGASQLVSSLPRASGR